ncbi:type II toxin-antitoxin system PemK/MazF family toxin [Telmatospirillum sp.]|uniref:type II toxin-antitoxin system PemK/MazF family toxin n=1 Tax=Telmatospirillum sp. TaxID=2079197 RepID=UPI002840D945|nr:type II toxin-antitoxin system PemK/MazF family toxin [Telmatospirillum sp.]MDR3436113.1 type II toxin-antitoxin system PemK/MazF family toxin [Telmatospirillum sp.]
MPLKYPVARRTILLCDYALGGFRPPEMIKRRPAIVISPRLPHRDGLCFVIPLSSSEPEKPVPYVVRVELPEPLPAPFDHQICWAKCDMVATVGYERLDLFRTGRGETGRRQYINPRVSVEIFEEIIQGILYGLGIGHLTLTPPASTLGLIACEGHFVKPQDPARGRPRHGDNKLGGVSFCHRRSAI